MGGSIGITKGLRTEIQCDEGFLLFGSKVTYCNGAEWIRELGTCINKTQDYWCDFEREDMCGWREHNTQDHLWKRISFDPDLHSNTIPENPISNRVPTLQKIEGQVQEYASTITMISSMLESTVPAIVSLFLGPWSDKFGRRPILLSTFTGERKYYIHP